MANPLDEVTGPHNDEGREARVIEKQLPVTIGIGSTIFEIAIWFVGFIPGAVISYDYVCFCEGQIFSGIYGAQILNFVIASLFEPLRLLFLELGKFCGR